MFARFVEHDCGGSVRSCLWCRFRRGHVSEHLSGASGKFIILSNGPEFLKGYLGYERRRVSHLL